MHVPAYLSVARLRAEAAGARGVQVPAVDDDGRLQSPDGCVCVRNVEGRRVCVCIHQDGTNRGRRGIAFLYSA